jgi:hypothetical protein
MLFDFGIFAATLPDSIKDQTTYKFVDPEARDYFAVTYEDVTSTSTTRSLVAAKMDRLSAVYDGRIVFEETTDFATLAGPSTGASGVLSLPDEVPLEVLFAYIKVSEVCAAFLSAIAVVGGTRATYDGIFRSARVVGDVEVAAQHLARRGAGRLSFTTPDRFWSPRNVRLVSSTIVVEASNDAARPHPPPRGEEVAYVDVGAIAMDGEGNQRPVRVQERDGLIEAWAFSHRHTDGSIKERYHVTQLTLPVAASDEIFVRSRATEGERNEANAIWVSLLSSLRVREA